MTLEEPQLLGAVVLTNDDRVWMRVPKDPKADWLGHWLGIWQDGSPAQLTWADIAEYNPKLLFIGTVPPVWEPMLPGAVVRDRGGRLFSRAAKDDLAWARYPDGGWFEWADIPGPEIIFPGVK